MRVLHAFDSLGRGGIETWLMNILRYDKSGTNFDFILNRRGGVYEKEAIDIGCRIYGAPPIRKLGVYLDFLKRILVEGKYDVLHVHGEEFMGDSMKVAFECGVPIRVAHTHSTVLARGRKSLEMVVRKARFLTVDRARIRRYSSHILGCSTEAMEFLAGSDWRSYDKCRLQYCGIDLLPFERRFTKKSIDDYRASLGLPPEAIVVGHAGSMGPSNVKNHAFLLSLFSKLSKRDSRYHLCLAGDGPLRDEISTLIGQLDLVGRVHMLGLIEDVPKLMTNAWDVHVLPSLREGLPIVGLEAVASGVFTICSDTITEDFTSTFKERVASLSLEDDLETWVSHIEVGVRAKTTAEIGVSTIDLRGFSIGESLRSLKKVYRNEQ